MRRAPFTKPEGWALWALAGIACSGLALGGTAWLFDLLGPGLGYDGVAGEATADVVIGLTALDPRTFISLLTTTGGCPAARPGPWC